MNAPALVALLLAAAPAPRAPVLAQIALPHSYYYRELYLPQLTSGPSSACWLAGGGSLVVSMAGSLWRVRLDGSGAEQLTDDVASDYQPDCAPDGRSVVFVRYDGRSMELARMDLERGTVQSLTANGAVNVEPRISPDGRQVAFVSTEGTGHFLLKTAELGKDGLAGIRTVVGDRQSTVTRYYYSPFDHAINPAWTRDGRELLFVSNREVAHGTGDIVRIPAGGAGEPRLLHREETSWHARPDVSPDGTRIVYSSYLGRQWNQLFLLPTAGGYPIPLTYGEHDATNPRWSPDGRRIAFVSNRDGDTALWLVDAFTGQQAPVAIGPRRYRRPHRTLTLHVRDENGRPLPARVAVTDERGRFHAPEGAWIHADDMKMPGVLRETRYFHGNGAISLDVPRERLSVVVSHGPAFAVVRAHVDAAGPEDVATITVPRLTGADGPGRWWSGDLHVHMNYGGHYRNTNERLAAQAAAEGLDLVYNLIVNKEQRVPDVDSFGADGTASPLVLHGQEYHSSYWGHLGLLGLTRHLLLPDYTAYPYTAVASPWPHNAWIAEQARAQGALVGYVHPFDEDPVASSTRLTNALPVDAALGRLDYYEVVGFSDHRTSAAVWYRLLDCGLRLPAAGGTDAMANYASLRGPVGLGRTYVKAEGPLTRESFLRGLKQGRSFATNGPLIALTVQGAGPGEALRAPGAKRLRYRATLASHLDVDHLELVWNGNVVADLRPRTTGRVQDIEGTVKVDGDGWLLLRAWNEGPHEDVLDLYPYATTSPVYVETGRRRAAPESAGYFLRWLDRLQAATQANTDYRTPDERAAVLADVAKARSFYEACAR